MKYWVTHQTSSNRLQTCRVCPHFVAETQTCGPLIKGKKVGSVHLCGCVMPLKTKLKYASCQLGKWEAEITQQQIDELTRALVGVKNTVTGKKNKELTHLYNKMFGKNNTVSGCSSCVKTMVNDLKRFVEQANEQ